MSPVLHSRLERNLLKKAQSLGSCANILTGFEQGIWENRECIGLYKDKKKRMETI